MAVVRWFLCFPAFFLEQWGFFPIRDLRQKKKVYVTYTKKKFPSKKKRDLRKKKSYATYAPPPQKATYAYFHNQATLSSGIGLCGGLKMGTLVSLTTHRFFWHFSLCR